MVVFHLLDSKKWRPVSAYLACCVHDRIYCSIESHVCVAFSSAYILDGVNLKGYFAYALSDLRDPGFGLYGQVHEEVIVKASLSNYRHIIRHNGFPIQGAAAQQCPTLPQPCPGCNVLSRAPVVGFLTLIGTGVLITLALIIYYTAKRPKDCY